MKPHDVLELPTYYIDHSDINAGYTNFEPSALGLDRPGLKVFDFHPNTVFINAATNAGIRSVQSALSRPGPVAGDETNRPRRANLADRVA